MSGTDSDLNQPGIRRLIAAGANIAGGAVGGAIGFLVGGPAGAVAGGAAGSAAGEALKHIGDEVSRRTLAPREATRVGGVLILAASKIKQRLEAGEQVRNDEFFNDSASGRSDAEELAESVLTKAQRETEEKKLHYMANLLSNVAFDGSISIAFAQQVTKLAEQLSYRQLCLIKLIAQAPYKSLRDKSYADMNSFPLELRQVLYELMDLFNRGLVHNGENHPLSIKDLVPKQMGVHGVGADLFNLMGLQEIPEDDLLSVTQVLAT